MLGSESDSTIESGHDDGSSSDGSLCEDLPTPIRLGGGRPDEQVQQHNSPRFIESMQCCAVCVLTDADGAMLLAPITFPSL